MKWDEFYRNNQAKIIIVDFSPEHTKQVIKELGIAYDKSPLLREMIDNWVIREQKSFSISNRPGMPRGKYATDPVTGAPLGKGLGEVRLSVEYCEASMYITDSGEAVKHTLTSVLVHELGHALTGRADDGVGMDMHQFNDDDHDYKGSNVKYVNKIFEELKLPKLNSYIAQNLPANRYTGLFDPDNIFLIENHQYTHGAAIDHSVVKNFGDDGNWDSSNLGGSKDLLIGDWRENTLIAGGGNDFLYGMDGLGRVNIILANQKLERV